jgi:hypothetical protein
VGILRQPRHHILGWRTGYIEGNRLASDVGLRILEILEYVEVHIILPTSYLVAGWLVVVCNLAYKQ